MVEYFQIFLERDFWVMIPELFLVFAVVFLTVLGVFFSKAVMSVEKRVIEVVLDLGILSLFWLMLLYYNQFGLDCYALNFQVKKDSISLFFSMLLMVGTLCSLVIAKSYIKNDTVNDFEYVVLVLLALLGLLTIVSCNDLLLIYLGIELQSLCLYVLATIKRHSRFSTEAGLKYFVLGAFSSGILLFGMSLFYGFTGITNLTDIEYFFLTRGDDSRNSFR
jgi:NADH-quinone oxidoreductase subunit N